MSSRPRSFPLSKTPPTPSPLSSHLSSDSTAASTVKVPSPLNPAAPSPKPPSQPPADVSFSNPFKSPATTSQSASNQSVRSRGASVSTIRPPAIPLGRVVSNPIPTSSSSSTTTLAPGDSDFRERSRASSVQLRGRSASPFRDLSFIWRSSAHGDEAPTPTHEQSTSWWTTREVVPRPWKQKTVPVEQTDGYIRTRNRVIEAATNVLGTTALVTHELLEVSVDLLRFAPIVGLEEAARTLLSIWDALQLVDINRLACLRLTERCATILMSIREEIANAGDEVGIELQPPLTRLVESFREVHLFLIKTSHRPFIKRYLQRDEIQRALGACHSSLTDALGMFNTSIQIRILKQVVAAERQRQADAAALLDSISHNVQGSQPIPIESSAYPRAISPAPTNRLLLTIEPDTTEGHDDSGHILAQLQAVTARQNERDMVYDTADLRQLMRTALQANNDAEMIRVLQVGRDEMPEAIKTLQRALEKEVERESLEEEAVLVSANIAAVEVGAPQIAQSDTLGLTRSATVHSTGSSSTTSSSVASSAGRSSRAPRDTLDREFIETGIDALRRLSGAEVTLPSWTITRYEVERDEKIGMGFFSDVYRGTWRNHVVAIKVLAPTTPRQLFVHEVSIWKTLQHPNVCELLGASSASSDPPWFFVSPYYKNGSLVTYLKGLPSLDGVDLLKMVHEIAKGMSYLHSQGVLHGDLKASNVLVNDKHHCIISDFGQSEMKSEAYRVSGLPLPHGTLRWQAPELMSAQSGLTQQIDVYAFAITVVELLTKGALPWPMADDDAVRHFVLRENMRPELPLQRVWSQQLSEILHSCWHRDPTMRPPFFKIDKDVQRLRALHGADLKESPASRHRGLEQMKARKSPDMHPIPLPLLPDEVTASFVEVGSAPSTDVSFMTAMEVESVTGHSQDYHGDYRDRKDPETDLSRTSSRASFQDSQSSEHIEFPRHVSPPPPDEHAQNIRDERRYRMLLQHEFHPSLTLPLWTPSQILIGAVGYHSKANYGEFVTLFSSFEPEKSSNGRVKNIPSLYGYGRVSQGSQRQDKRNVAQRGMDMIQSWLGPRNRAGEATYSRRYSAPLRSGHKAANLFTESTVYRYMEDLVTPKKWFKANADTILAIYGEEHRITKEDLYLVIGTLEAQDYALFVSHEHPDGQVNFNVFSATRNGRPWGEFTFSFDISSSFLGGPKYEEEPVGAPQYARKISTSGNNGRWDSVLLARLRFKPDSTEPTSL
ncbi:hypothetical protein BD311DRAFT_869668 [Dichomitus squalens]|uniref:Protein kinase domain-containing protein n=1 Tax=Dichomitus squalens TaxID=114155 RepID=A0A4Q9M4V9_9APHY|nr:hypothetical protein BD311DRAFT_869668 [Dichomitus squalens]